MLYVVLYVIFSLHMLHRQIVGVSYLIFLYGSIHFIAVVGITQESLKEQYFKFYLHCYSCA